MFNDHETLNNSRLYSIMDNVRYNMVIAFINRKGGTGKTTSAAYIAQALHQRGGKVLGLDLDPEKSWLKWASSGALPYAVEAIAKDDDLEGRVSQYNGVVVIDTPPNDGEIIYTVATFADEVIVPISATALDLNRLSSTLQTVEKIEKIAGLLDICPVYKVAGPACHGEASC
jgi:chromosome partitioning protein